MASFFAPSVAKLFRISLLDEDATKYISDMIKSTIEHR